ncbi:MAG: TRM11 family SAM-dependent methyltransferase [Promethearchaeota archaeon]
MDDPSLSILEIKRLLSLFYDDGEISLNHENYRILEAKVPELKPGLFQILTRSVSIHYSGVRDFVYITGKRDLDEAINTFFQLISGDIAFKTRLLKLSQYHNSFSITRIFHTLDISTDINLRIKRFLGSLVEKKTRMRVCLSNPKVRIFVIITREKKVNGSIKFFISINGRHHETRNYRMRLAKFRPSCRIGTMNPPLSSIMINLVHPPLRKRGLILDPYCGTGGILIEALVRGVDVIGMDINGNSIKGALMNLKYFNKEGHKGIHLIQGSIFQVPFRDASSLSRELSAICTDPPYGRISSLRKVPFNDYLKELLSFKFKRGMFCFASPESEKAEVLGLIKHMFKNKARIFAERFYEHASFSRIIFNCIIP